MDVVGGRPARRPGRRHRGAPASCPGRRAPTRGRRGAAPPAPATPRSRPSDGRRPAHSSPYCRSRKNSSVSRRRPRPGIEHRLAALDHEHGVGGLVAAEVGVRRVGTEAVVGVVGPHLERARGQHEPLTGECLRQPGPARRGVRRDGVLGQVQLAVAPPGAHERGVGLRDGRVVGLRPQRSGGGVVRRFRRGRLGGVGHPATVRRAASGARVANSAPLGSIRACHPRSGVAFTVVVTVLAVLGAGVMMLVIALSGAPRDSCSWPPRWPPCRSAHWSAATCGWTATSPSRGACLRSAWSGAASWPRRRHRDPGGRRPGRRLHRHPDRSRWSRRSARRPPRALFLLLLLWWRRHELDGILDGIVYAGMVGIGFAFVENILYLAAAYNGTDGLRPGRHRGPDHHVRGPRGGQPVRPPAVHLLHRASAWASR